MYHTCGTVNRDSLWTACSEHFSGRYSQIYRARGCQVTVRAHTRCQTVGQVPITCHKRDEKVELSLSLSAYAVIMPPSYSTSTGTHLTTSRIHRILRPLKTKCAGLALIAPLAGGKSTGGIRITYSSRNKLSRTNSSSSSTSNSDERPPLTILPPPEQIHHSKSTSQYDSTGNLLALSKNIYGIRDAFKNVISIAFGSVSDEPHTRSSTSSAASVDQAASSSKGRVVSLAGLCAIVVGKELRVGHEGDREGMGESTEDEECDKEEEEATKWVDEIYEEIPFHVRR